MPDGMESDGGELSLVPAIEKPVAAAESPRGGRSSGGKEKRKMCLICRIEHPVEAMPRMSAYCWVDKRAVEAAQRMASRQGPQNSKFFKESMKDPERARLFILARASVA